MNFKIFVLFALLAFAFCDSFKTTTNTTLNVYNDNACTNLEGALNMVANQCLNLTGDSLSSSSQGSLESTNATTVYYYQTTSDCSGNAEGIVMQAGKCYPISSDAPIQSVVLGLLMILSLVFF
ncbi:hypothetical protein M0811_03506 [Anaeramoeba ignava]|uniref:Transmembrane protein n=1 Tax=Anaeramoeba ignava TaxID=1746090 RepID=A0A9Q0L6V3_ANAIG|nr:hypothetical protein M0811_03506 [Anaeramoeba ignava]